MSQTPIENAIENLGELFIMGFKGLELPDETSSFIAQAKVGGIILFAHNFESPAQVANLNNSIQACNPENPLWIAVDQEGGRVQRFKKGFTIIPEARTLAGSQSPKLIFDIAEMMAKELKAVGVNLNFCPVADINTNPDNPIIGNRAYGTDEPTVTQYASAMVRGHLTGGVQPCVKHFPGHGDTSVDSHLDLPRVDTDLETLRDREFKPFVKAFKSRCSMVMTAHILNPKIDPEWPATLSKKTLQDILRKELRYTRLIVSDDLEMEAITKHYGADDAPRLALQAGCDLLIYRSEEAARKAYGALKRALETGKLAPQIVLQAAARNKEVKKEVLGKYVPVNPNDLSKKTGIPEHQALIDRI